MKITGPDQNFQKKDRIADAGKAGKAVKVSIASSSGTKETSSSLDSAAKIAVSDLGKEVAKIHKQVASTPDIRVEKVDELKSKIDDGTYYVSSDKIAGKIIEDIIAQG